VWGGYEKLSLKKKKRTCPVAAKGCSFCTRYRGRSLHYSLLFLFLSTSLLSFTIVFFFLEKKKTKKVLI
jgi:hypothetical protein